jgi:hypothetical protein
MSKIWKIGSDVDTLSYIVAAPNRETAVATLERLTGPQNPARRRVTELPGVPPGYIAAESGLLEEDPEYDG